MESEAEHREIPEEEAAVKSSGEMKKRHRGRAPPEAKLWIPEETGRHRHEDDLPCKSDMAQGITRNKDKVI
jgi:hypothetical protein